MNTASDHQPGGTASVEASPTTSGVIPPVTAGSSRTPDPIDARVREKTLSKLFPTTPQAKSALQSILQNKDEITSSKDFVDRLNGFNPEDRQTLLDGALALFKDDATAKDALLKVAADLLKQRETALAGGPPEVGKGDAPSDKEKGAEKKADGKVSSEDKKGDADLEKLTKDIEQKALVDALKKAIDGKGGEGKADGKGDGDEGRGKGLGQGGEGGAGDGGGGDNGNSNSDPSNKLSHSLDKLANKLGNNSPPSSNNEKGNPKGKGEDKEKDGGFSDLFKDDAKDKKDLAKKKDDGKSKSIADMLGDANKDSQSDVASPAANLGGGNKLFLQGKTTVPQAIAQNNSSESVPFGGGFGGGGESGFGGAKVMGGGSKDKGSSGEGDGAFFSSLNFDEAGGYGGGPVGKMNYAKFGQDGFISSNSGGSSSDSVGTGEDEGDGPDAAPESPTDRVAKQILIPPMGKTDSRRLSGGKFGTIFDVVSNGNLCTGDRKEKLSICTRFSSKKKGLKQPSPLGERT